MDNIQNILNGDFQFNKWSSHQASPENFDGDLSEFGTFDVYEDFKSFLSDYEFLLEDAEGTLLGVDMILSDKDNFDNHFESSSVKSGENDIEYSMINKPFIFGEANTHDNPMHFISLDNIKDESDLIAFINDVLMDLGEVTHSAGIKNEYEVVKVRAVQDFGFGIVEHDGKEYALEEDAYVVGAREREWNNLALDDGKPFYKASAVDQEGKSFEVVWETFEEWEDLYNEDEMCDWENPESVNEI